MTGQAGIVGVVEVAGKFGFAEAQAVASAVVAVQQREQERQKQFHVWVVLEPELSGLAGRVR